MSNDDSNRRGPGAPATGPQSAAPTAPPLPSYMMATTASLADPASGQNSAYADSGMNSVVDQFAGMGLGTGLPPLPGYPPSVPLMPHGGGLSYSPALYNGPFPSPNGIMPGTNGGVWLQNGIKWPTSDIPFINEFQRVNQHQQNAEFAKSQREQLAKYYESIGINCELPPLENRRSSYSTTESTPATPFYGSTASRDVGTRVAVFDRGSSAYTTPSPPQITSNDLIALPKMASPRLPAPDRELRELLALDPSIPPAVPAVFTPRENMKTLEQSLVNHIPGNRNVYIRGLHPTTDDDLLLKYAERFGIVETSKAIIDTGTGACKGFGFAKFKDIKDSEACIRGFYAKGYEVGFARVITHQDKPSGGPIDPIDPIDSIDYMSEASADASAYRSSDPLNSAFPLVMPRAVKMCGCHCNEHTSFFTNFDPWDQESFNSRLKAEGDESSTNLYISNLPKSVSETDLATVLCNYTILSAKILRDNLGNSRGVGFARFESREICDEIIEIYTGQPLGEEALPMQIRYADTPAQKELKRITSERRQFRTNEYNVGAYGTPLVGMSPTIYSQPGWKQRGISSGSTSSNITAGDSPASENGSGDEGITIHVESPVVANGSTRSSPIKKEKD
ncbi:hypothetical protein TruAng_000241 [Truncatella angustata]|nr:hypothetical protein TruAng_000241 [Truncatella angustata]